MPTPNPTAQAAAAVKSSLKLFQQFNAETVRFSCNADEAIEIGGRRFIPDISKAYVEFALSHTFPVVTVTGTAIHPQVLANSYQSMEGQVFDLNHIVKNYDPRNNPHDRILGSIQAVELIAPDGLPEDGVWTVQADKARVPYMRCVASVCKAAEGVEAILAQHLSGRRTWTVSMENTFFSQDSGFLVKGSGDTRPDLAALGWRFVHYLEAPEDLQACVDLDKCEVIKNWKGRETVFMVGGLSSVIHYAGTGITPVGKEKEAEILRMAASACTEPVVALTGGLKILEQLK